LRERIRLSAPPRDVRLLEPAAGASTLEAVLASERERAFAAGLVAGRAAERLDAGGRLDLASERIAAARAEAEAELGRVAIDLALSIASAILGTEIAQGRYDLEGLVRATLAEANVGRNACVVHLNPVDHARLAEIKFRSGTTVEADEGVPLGDVHVETSMGLLVREAAGSLEKIERSLREELV